MKMYSGKKYYQHWRKMTFWLMAFDIISMFFAFFFALLLRYDGVYSAIPHEQLMTFYHSILIHIAVTLIFFTYLRLYRTVWQYAGNLEAAKLMLGNLITVLFMHIFNILFFSEMPETYYVLGGILQFFLVTGIRFSYRFLRDMIRAKNLTTTYNHNVLVYGAGSAGRIIVKDIQKNRAMKEKICCYVDDDENKWDRYIDGIVVAGGRNQLKSIVKNFKIDKIYLSIRRISVEEQKHILDACKETGCQILLIPTLEQVKDENISIGSMREVRVEDLLGRAPITVNNNDIFQYIKDKVILVTGGGGSIGSELCRQVAAHDPKQLVIFDIYENNAYDIQQELKRDYPELNLAVRIGSVRDTGKMYRLFQEFKPQIVFHAAAHKHVPLMEDSPAEAIKNNVMGTYKTAFAAMANNCEKFVLISTDKAVNPTNIMGATKRICEMIVQSFGEMIRQGKADEIPLMFTAWNDEYIEKKSFDDNIKHTKTEFVAVRFGNVLGSNGSVIPLFKKQIEKGGPVTVTHPDITRFFMTIPEAVSLVMQAGAYAHGGEIFVLDMGEPVKIDTLARNLIKLSGHKPDGDIKIVYTGLRPGEKLYEEKLMAEEGLKRTKNQLIHIGAPIKIDIPVFLQNLRNLMIQAYKDPDDIIEAVEHIVPTYHPTNRS